jgi:hypothetical protein
VVLVGERQVEEVMGEMLIRWGETQQRMTRKKRMRLDRKALLQRKRERYLED